jgi:hypothetical protein
VARLALSSGRSPDWLKMKNPDGPAVQREAEEIGHVSALTTRTRADSLETTMANHSKERAEAGLYAIGLA